MNVVLNNKLWLRNKKPCLKSVAKGDILIIKVNENCSLRLAFNRPIRERALRAKFESRKQGISFSFWTALQAALLKKLPYLSVNRAWQNLIYIICHCYTFSTIHHQWWFDMRHCWRLFTLHVQTHVWGNGNQLHQGSIARRRNGFQKSHGCRIFTSPMSTVDGPCWPDRHAPSHHEETLYKVFRQGGVFVSTVLWEK